MQVQKITSQNNSSFKGLRYQNGIKTKNALNENIKRMLKLLEIKSAPLKNVNLILTDAGKIQLDICNPRYLNSKFNRFYTEQNYEIRYYDGDDYGGKGHYFRNLKENDSLYIKLQPTQDPGIYDVVPTLTTINSDFGKVLSRTLEAAELIENVSTKINEAEQKYGMDCVNVLNNIDELTLEAERTKLIDDIKQHYVLLGESEKSLESWRLKDLYRFINGSPNVDNLKHYKVALKNIQYGGNMIEINLLDEKGYLDEIYKEFYEKEGLKIENSNSFVRYILPLKGEYPKYSFGSEDGKTYEVSMDTYEMGSNLSCIEHFKLFFEIASRLDRVAYFIEKYLNTGKVNK